MTKQKQGAIIISVVALVFIGLQVGLDVQTGLAGLFIMGMAAGLVLSEQMSKDAKGEARQSQAG